MLNPTETLDNTLPANALARRKLILVDHAGAHPRLLSGLQREMEPHAEAADGLVYAGCASSSRETILLWIITPSALVSWGALLADPLEERTAAMLAALGERMEDARRRLVPLQRAGNATGLNIRVRIAHGALLETLVRVAREEVVESVLLAASPGVPSELYGHPAADLQNLLARRLACPVMQLFTP